jgi:hypothetical protein
MFCEWQGKSQPKLRSKLLQLRSIFCTYLEVCRYLLYLSRYHITPTETLVFGAEFVAMKHGIEKLRGLWYKLHMMGIPLTGSSYIYGDNKSQVTNLTKIKESTLKKKCNSICYHAVRESVGIGESLITHIRTHGNLSDLMTKVTKGAKRQQLGGGILYEIYDGWSNESIEHYPGSTAN